MRAASLTRELGHDFVARDLSADQLDEVTVHLSELLDLVGGAEPRQQSIPSEGFAKFKAAIPERDQAMRHQLFADSIVSGAANPMGRDGSFWREGDTAVMEVTLGTVVEGTPGRAHGGIVAALLDQTMGLVNAIHHVLTFSVQLDIFYLEPTPVNQSIAARAWLAQRTAHAVH